MALKKSVVTAHGLSAVDAYLRVEGVRFDSKTSMSFRLRSYVSTDKPHFNDQEFKCDYDINGLNPIAQAYEYVKTTDEFIDATDC